MEREKERTVKSMKNKKGLLFAAPYYLRRIRLLVLRLLAAGTAAGSYLRLKLFDEQFVHFKNSPPTIRYVLAPPPLNNPRGTAVLPQKNRGPSRESPGKLQNPFLSELKVWAMPNTLSSTILQKTRNYFPGLNPTLYVDGSVFENAISRKGRLL